MFANKKKVQKKLSKRLRGSNSNPFICVEPDSNSRKQNAEVWITANTRSKKIVPIFRKLNSQWPVNQQLRSDIFRGVILDKPGAIPLLESQGAIFDINAGNFHLAALTQEE